MKNRIKGKSTLILLLTLLMALSIMSGCGSSGKSQDDATGGDSVTEEITFTLNISYSGGLYEDLMTDIANKVSELSDGRIKGRVIASGTMGSEREVGEAVQLGTLDMAYLSDNGAETLVGGLGWAFLPYMISSYEEADKYINSGWVRKEVWKSLEKANLIGIAACENGFRNFGSATAPVNNFADFKGQKVRVPEQADLLRFYELCGALPVGIAGSEVVTALEQKTIDAVDNSIYNFKANGYMDSLKYVTITNHQYTSNNIVVSRNFWESLSQEDQDIIRQAAEYACQNYTKTRREGEEQVIKEYKDKGYVFVEPSSEFQAELKKVARQIWDEFGSKYDAAIMERIVKEFGDNLN
ncbi:MAG: TRAP transporter substrate-binding protein [Bacillota bacterium]|jgi:tripartite ATP-independent transporter DctP family solute receptor